MGSAVKIADRPRRNTDHKRDETLIRSIYQEHGRSLLAYATRQTGDRMAAEDVVQEVLVRAWRNADVLADELVSVRAWLLTVARNLIIDRARAKAARPAETEQTPTNVPVTSDHAGAVVDSMALLHALAALRPHHRVVLVEVYYRGKTMSEAAKALGIPEGTVRSRIFHGLRSLRVLLAGSDAHEPEVMA